MFLRSWNGILGESVHNKSRTSTSYRRSSSDLAQIPKRDGQYAIHKVPTTIGLQTADSIYINVHIFLRYQILYFVFPINDILVGFIMGQIATCRNPFRSRRLCSRGGLL